MIRYIIFDLDDTLYPELAFAESGYNAVSKHISDSFGYPQTEALLTMQRLFSEDRRHIFDRLAELYKLPKSQAEQWIKLYREHKPEINYYADVLPTLSILKDKRYSTGIITDGLLQTQINKLKALDAYSLFGHIIVTSEFNTVKPEPLAFELMRKHFCCSFSEMVYIGDNPKKDFYISSITEMKTIRIIREGQVYARESYYRDVKETVKIQTLEELIPVLEQIDE